MLGLPVCVTLGAVGSGASPLTLAGLAGVGDIVLTCTGDLSRNRTVGVRLGKGEKLEDITATMKVGLGVCGCVGRVGCVEGVEGAAGRDCQCVGAYKQVPGPGEACSCCWLALCGVRAPGCCRARWRRVC